MPRAEDGGVGHSVSRRRGRALDARVGRRETMSQRVGLSLGCSRDRFRARCSRQLSKGCADGGARAASTAFLGSPQVFTRSRWPGALAFYPLLRVKPPHAREPSKAERRALAAAAGGPHWCLPPRRLGAGGLIPTRAAAGGPLEPRGVPPADSDRPCALADESRRLAPRLRPPFDRRSSWCWWPPRLPRTRIRGLLGSLR